VISGQGQELLMQPHYLMATLDRIIHFVGRVWNFSVLKLVVHKLTAGT